MAGTKNTAHVVQLKPVEVPKCMQDGEKFIKWDEVMQKIVEGFVTVVDQMGWGQFKIFSNG
jgi:hypothetical protein